MSLQVHDKTLVGMTHPLLTWSSAPGQPGNTPAFIIEPRPNDDT